MRREISKLALLLVWVLPLSIDADDGCNAVINDEPVGCSSTSPLDIKSDSPLISEKSKKSDNINITASIKEITVLHNSQNIIINRKAMKGIDACPPFCIEPLTIDGVKSVAELETLAFIDKLKEKKARLLIDVRENKQYKLSTIPGAINLPASMIEDESPYQSDVLTLLGAKKFLDKNTTDRWYFKDAQYLLIFGKSATTNEASTVIKKLLALGYPASKILYYRGGIESWKNMGLTLF